MFSINFTLANDVFYWWPLWRSVRYGLDTSDYSFAYVAGWSSNRELSELKASLDTIRTAAHDLITAIDAAMEKEVTP